jgi:hypothetical protein
MSTVDMTAIDMAAKGATVAPPAAAAPEGEKPPGDGSDGDGGKTLADARPDSSSLINTILDKHGLGSPEELADFVDRIAELDGQIGDNDPAELLKAKTTLEAYQREWAKQEEEKLKASETPEQTIARLEREKADRDNKAAQRDKQRRNSEAAKKAVKSYADVVTSTAKAEKDFPAEYLPFVHELLGVGSPVYDVNIQDRAAVKKMTKEWGMKRVQEFADVVIKRYVEGKQQIPKVPSGASETTPVTPDAKPKTLKEAGAQAKAMLTAHWNKR